MIVSEGATASSSKWKAPAHVADSGSDIDESTDLEESDSDSCSESESNIDEDLDPIKVLVATHWVHQWTRIMSRESGML